MILPTATYLGKDDRFAEVFLKGRTVTSPLGLRKPPIFKAWKPPQPDRCFDKVKEDVGYTDAPKDQSAADFILPNPLPFESLFVQEDPSAKPDRSLVEAKDDLGYADAQKGHWVADIFLPSLLPLEDFFVPEEPSATPDRCFVEMTDGVGYADSQKDQSATDLFLPIDMALSLVPFKACLDPEEPDAYAGEDIKANPSFGGSNAVEENECKNGTNATRNSLKYSRPGDCENLISSTGFTADFLQTRERLVKSDKEGGAWSTDIMNACSQLQGLENALTLDLSASSGHLKTKLKRPRGVEVEERELRNRKKIRPNNISSIFVDSKR